MAKRSKTTQHKQSQFCAALFAICLLLNVPAAGQDAGIPDTVIVLGDSLFTMRSAPVRIAVTNDMPIKTLSFGMVHSSIDTGFAVLDSIVWVGRMSDPNVLNFRSFGPRDDDGISPDSTVLTAFKAGPTVEALLPGSGPIVELWMTGISPGTMAVDSGFMPTGGNFVMIPFIGDFSGQPFTPQFVTTPVTVVEGIGIACGNIDNSPGGSVDIADLTALIDFLFISFTIPPGILAGNVDGSANSNIDIADLTFLIDHLFINFVPLLCPE